MLERQDEATVNLALVASLSTDRPDPYSRAAWAFIAAVLAAEVRALREEKRASVS